MASKLFNGLTIPLVPTTQIIPTPGERKVTMFAREGNSVWVKFSNDTEERSSE